MKPSNCYSLYFLALLSATVALALGCGLAEYEGKYEKQQERMNYIDQENQYLGSPVELPVSKESKGPVPEIHLRLPLGISTNYEEKPEGILYHYPKRSSKVSKDSDQKMTEIESVYFAVEMNKDWNDFKKRGLGPFKDVDPRNVRKVNLEVPGRPPRAFQTISFTDGTDPTWSYQFYFFQDDVYRVAIGFRGTEKALASESAKQAMEFSVKSLAVGKVAEPIARKSSGG
jgi:hypothetical protein